MDFESALRRLVEEYRGRMPDSEIIAALRDEADSVAEVAAEDLGK